MKLLKFRKFLIPIIIGVSFSVGNIAASNSNNCNYFYCSNEAFEIFEKGYENLKNENYENAIYYFEEYLEKNNGNENINLSSAKYNLYLGYLGFANNQNALGEYENAIKNVQKALGLFSDDFIANYNSGIIYSNLKDFENAKKYFDIAEKNATNNEESNSVKNEKEKLEQNIKRNNIQKTLGINDQNSGYQYYLADLNIHNAWKKVKNNYEVIVAVIDDGIDVNHPDLQGKIWNNPSLKFGENPIIDFSDDTDFFGKPSGSHGNLVSGIIGANRNNNVGIAGIANNVKIMPIKVFDINENSYIKNVEKGINYAIENNANIINLSLSGNHFSYSAELDEVIRKAYENGIVVVIGAGNGDYDDLTKSIGLNLDNNPVSPVCNNSGNTKYSIGVFATGINGYKTSWTNYGKCAKYFAPGEQIISTSIPDFNDSEAYYTIGDGTSFSTPIISGIIALGFNEYGKVNPDLIQLALTGSYVEKINSYGNTAKVLDAEKYLDSLGKILNNSKSEKNESMILAEKTMERLDTKLESFSNAEKRKIYIQLTTKLNDVKNNYNLDMKNLMENLIIILQERSK